ncbi:MAG: rRNA maturation RNase YbeY [Armatimonadota bacterium]
MGIEISGPDGPGLPRERLRRRLQDVLEAEGCPTGFELSLLLTGDAEMARLHQEWMGLPGPTDVLSFPQDDPREGPAPGASLGDVAISLDTAARQAAEAGIPLAHEVLLLAVHGTLHLLGYDDTTDEAFRRMREREMRYVPEAFRDAEEMAG